MEERDHAIFFQTLTYKDSMLPSINVNGYRIKYADNAHITAMFKRMRHHKFFGDRQWSFLLVSEFGKDTHRPHWHILYFVEKLPDDNEWTYMSMQEELYEKGWKYWSKNFGTRKKPDYKTFSDLVVDTEGRSTYDFHFVQVTQSGSEDVAFYVTKYVLKYDEYVKRLHSALKLNLDIEEFSRVWSIVKPKFRVSRNFGSPVIGKDDNGLIFSSDRLQYLRSCLDNSVDYPAFVSPTTGYISPMAPYLRKWSVTVDDAIRFLPSDQVEDFITLDKLSTGDHFFKSRYYSEQDLKKIDEDFTRISKKLNDRNEY